MNDRNIIFDRLSRRDEERIDKLQKIHKAKEDVQSTDEQAEYFGSVFREKLASIQELIAQIPNLEPAKLQGSFKEIKKEINNLQKYVASSSIFLKEFNMRKYLKIVQDLQSECYELEEKYTPRKKFGFSKKRPVKSETPQHIQAQTSDIPDGSISTQTHINQNLFGFHSRQNEVLILVDHEVYQRDVTLTNLTNCMVCLKGIMGTLHISKLTNCIILSGPVNTSVFVNNCTDCKIAVICQQLRMHSSKNIDVYLHVTCKGIIEDCNNIKIAPFNYQYEKLKEHIKESSLDLKFNNWNKIDDFNWLSTDIPSPNWTLLDETKQIKDWFHLETQLPANGVQCTDDLSIIEK